MTIFSGTAITAITKGEVKMDNNIHLMKYQEEPDPEREEAIKELQRLLICYQSASYDDRKIVWAVLNKYANTIDI